MPLAMTNWDGALGPLCPPLTYPVAAITNLAYLPLLLTFIVGLLKLPTNGAKLLALSVIGVYMLVFVVAFGGPRYHLPMVALMAVYGSAAFARGHVRRLPGSWIKRKQLAGRTRRERRQRNAGQQAQQRGQGRFYRRDMHVPATRQTLQSVFPDQHKRRSHSAGGHSRIHQSQSLLQPCRGQHSVSPTLSSVRKPSVLCTR